MKSELHAQLQGQAKNYLMNKNYWICGEEVPMPPGICDAWGMKRIDQNTMAIEVKVSRADFRSRSQQVKETGWPQPLGNHQYILCPAGLIFPDEVHPNWGLLWANGNRIVNKKKSVSVEMTAEQKLNVLIYFLNSGVNDKRPKLI